MDRILAMIPKNLLAFLAIAGGIAFIVISQPPHTVCDSQAEVIEQSQQKFLYKDPKSKSIKTTKYERLRDLRTLTKECTGVVSDKSEYRRALWEPTEMMVRLAWGEKPPATYTAKFGWLDTADLSLFCKLKNVVIAFYGNEAWDGFRERMMHELPGAKDLPRNQVWDLSIFSENCAKYP